MNTRVMAQTKPKPTLAPPVPGNFLQRKCACGGTPGFNGECEECRKKKLPTQSPQFRNNPSNFSTLNLLKCPPLSTKSCARPGSHSIGRHARPRNGASGTISAE